MSDKKTSVFTVGMQVIVRAGSHGSKRVARVTRSMERFVEIDDGQKFAHDGFAYPRYSSSRAIVPATEEAIAKIQLEHKIFKARLVLEKLSDSEALAAAAVALDMRREEEVTK